MTTAEMLEKNATLAWHEPWPGMNKDLSQTDAHVELRASARECVLMARLVVARKSIDTAMSATDEQLLLDWIAVHWAKVVE